MRRINKNKLLGDAGEYYVAFQLARRGINPALLSQNALGCDILATDDGTTVISIQVKTSEGKGSSRQWCVGKHKPTGSNSLLYVFVNMLTNNKIECFIVPSKFVAETATWHNKVPLFKITEEQKEFYRDKWELITSHFSSE